MGDEINFDQLDEDYEKYTDSFKENSIDYKYNDIKGTIEQLNKKIDDGKKEIYNNNNISSKIDDLNNTYKNVKSRYNDYLIENEKLKSVIKDYNMKVATMNNFSNYSYIGLIFWFIVLILLFSIVMMSIIEDKKEMNTISRILFFIILLYIFKKIVQYLGGYIQREV